MIIDDFEIKKIDMEECALYLGGSMQRMPAEITERMREAEALVIETGRPRCVYNIYKIKHADDSGVEFEDIGFKLLGKDISRHLELSRSAVFMCVTISDGIDMLIRREQIRDMSRAMVVDAAAGVMAEAVCDEAEKRINMLTGGGIITSRFGLGYGDLPLEQTGDFLNILEAGKAIGVYAEKSFMLTPAKSVACILGLKQ